MSGDAPIVLEEGSYGGPGFEGLPHPAVLVVDMSNDFGHPDGVYARNGVVCDTFPAAVEAVAQVLRAATAAGIPTLAVNQVIYEGPDGRSVGGGGLVEGRPWLDRDGLRPGSWGAENVEGLPAVDFQLEKPRASGFIGTPLEILLRGLRVETLIIGGCYTNQCVESTVRDAWARDFHVLIVEDGVAAFDPRLHRAALDSMLPLARQLRAAEIISLIGSTAPAR